ncbi:unnamed protein product [Rhodiola kirilowii]
MIYRKWSLLTGPAAMLGAVVGTVVLANFIFADNDSFLKAQQKKQETLSSSK